MNEQTIAEYRQLLIDLSAEYTRLRTSVVEFADLMQSDAGQWAFDEFTDEMQEAYNKMVYAARGDEP